MLVRGTACAITKGESPAVPDRERSEPYVLCPKLPGRLDVRESVSVSIVVRKRYEELEETFCRATAATEWVRLLCSI